MDASTLECPICKDIARNAVETSCCHHIFCAQCIGRVDTCALCRELFTTTPNYTIRRIIEAIPQECPQCTKSIARSDIRAHKNGCVKLSHLSTLEEVDAATDEKLDQEIELLTPDKVKDYVIFLRRRIRHHDGISGM